MSKPTPLPRNAANIVRNAKDRAILNNGRLLRAFLAAWRDEKALTLEQIADAMEDNTFVVELLVYLDVNDIQAADEKIMDAVAARRKDAS